MPNRTPAFMIAIDLLAAPSFRIDVSGSESVFGAMNRCLAQRVGRDRKAFLANR